jgi:hypothetical protein
VSAPDAVPKGSAQSGRGRRISAQRWWVHVALIAAALVSLLFVASVLLIHIIVGLLFVVLVCVHLVQRRRASMRLARQLPRLGSLQRGIGRMALADAVLLLMTTGMLASGLWDWASGHPSRIRWHAVTGVALAVLLLIHTLRRRGRLRRSRIC